MAINIADSTTLSLVNGVATDAIAINNRGLAYGDGVFETIQVVDTVPQFFERHLQRLQLGCQRLNISLNVAELKRDVSGLLNQWSADTNAQAILKIIITRGYSGRGYQYDSDVQADRMVTLSPLSIDREQWPQGITLRVCQTRLSVNPTTAGIKHLNRLENVLARAEWQNDQIAEGLMLNIDGDLIEGTMSNVFIVANDKLLTPKLDGCGVAGIIRNIIIDTVVKQLNYSVTVDRLTLDDVKAADEVFICNSLIGVCPVVDIAIESDSYQKEIGPMTKKIQQVLSGLIAHA